MGEVSMGFIGALLSLYEADGQTLSELSEAVSLEKSTMTGLIDRMVKAGLVTRESDASDRRVLRVWLTPQGKEVQSGVDKVLAQAYKDLTRGMADKEIDKIEKTLAHLIDNARRG